MKEEEEQQEIELAQEIRSFTSKEDVQDTIKWFIGILEEMGSNLEKWIGKAELGVNTTVEGKRQLNTDHHKENCKLLFFYLKDKIEKNEKNERCMGGADWADEFVAIKLCHEVLCIWDSRCVVKLSEEDLENPMI